jgi:hypothetical protein
VICTNLSDSRAMVPSSTISCASHILACCAKAPLELASTKISVLNILTINQKLRGVALRLRVSRVGAGILQGEANPALDNDT